MPAMTFSRAALARALVATFGFVALTIANATVSSPPDLLPVPHRVPSTRTSSTSPRLAPAAAFNLTNAGTWLLGQQYTTGEVGAFPWTPGDAQPAPTNTQGATAEGLLRLYALTGNTALLNAAVANGQCQVTNCISGWTYGDGSHRFATHDPLFLIELSQFSGDPQYANFVDTNFWQRLAAGTYGASSNLDAAGYANYIVSNRTAQGISELAAWDISKLVVAAHEAGQSTAEVAFMNGVLASLNAADGTHNTYDVIGLTGAIWASAVSGIALDPTTGTWASANSTAGLATSLLTYQAPGGGFVGSTTLAVSDANADVQTTGYAMLGLSALNRAAYISKIQMAGSYVASLQQANGEIVDFSGATGNETGSVEAHGEASEAYADTIAGVDRWVAPTGADSGDCSIQTSPCQTIVYAISQAGPGNTIHIASGVYDLLSNPALLVTKDGLRLVGEGATQPQIRRTAGSKDQALLIVSGAKNVQVQNLEFDLDQTFIAEGIIANGFVDGLSIGNNHFVQSRSNSGQNSSFKWRNAISINDDNGNSQSIGIAPGSNVSITGNTINGTANIGGGVFLRSGVDMDNSVGTISGNTITTGVHDIHVRFSTTTASSSGTTTLIDNNTLNGRGLEFDAPNGGAGAITISNNHINAPVFASGCTAADCSLVRLIDNQQNIPTTLSGNTFAGHLGSYRGVLIENYPGIALNNNTFTPANGAANFVSLVVSNKEINSGTAIAPYSMALTATGNTFNGSGSAGAGTAVEFLDDNDANGAAAFGSLIFGGAGAGQANNFDGNLRWYFHLDDYNCNTVTASGSVPVCTTPPLPDYNGAIGNASPTNTQVRPFTGNISAAANNYAGVMPSAMTPAQKNALFAATYDKGANPVLGTVDYGLTETEPFVYVNATFAGNYGDTLNFTSSSSCGNQTVYFGVNAFATIPDGLTHVQSGGTVCVAKGAYPASVTIATNPVQIVGDGNTASDTVITGAVSLSVSGASNAAPLLLQNLRVSNSAGNGVSVATASHLAFDTVAFAGNGGSGLDLDATSDDVVITNSVFGSNVGAGLRTASIAHVSNVNITGSTFSNNAAGIILFGASGSGNGQISNWTIGNSQFLSNDNANASGFGGGIWLKTGGAGSAINGFSVSNSTFADNGSSSTLNQVGITVRARPGTTLTGVSICNNTFSETATPGTQLTGINVFDDTASGGTYQPIVICGTTTLNNIGEGISGLEQFNSRGTKPFVSLTGTLSLNNSDGFNDVRFSPAAPAAYVDDNYTGDPNGTAVSFSHPQLVGSPVSATIGVNAFATISAAVANVQSGATIYVAAGTYAESSGANQNLVVGIPVTILGEQATVDARTRDVGGGDDASETILVPGVEDASLTLNSLGNSAVVTVNSSNVTIDGVVVDGDNSALTSGINLNGANPDADSGMFVSGSSGTLKNIVFRNVGGSGIFACEDLANCASSSAGGDNVITRNRFTNITNPSTWGIGIYAGDDFYAQINDNLFDQVRAGIQFAENDHLADTGTQPPQVQGNEIHATRIGLFFNLFYQNATTWTVSGNRIFAAANAGQTGEWRGIQIESMQSAQTAVITGNVIDGSALLGQRSTVGYALNNWTSSNSATTSIDGGSVSNADVGVLATDAMNYTGPVDGVLIQNIAFNNIALGAIYVEDTNEQTGSAAVTIGAGNTYNSVGHQLVLAGAAPAVSFSGGSVDNVLVRAAATFLYGTPSTGPCTSAACTTANASINTGIADVAAGGSVYVEAGTFTENVIANKSVMLKGPKIGIAGNDPSRDGTNEAAISPATGIALKVNANNVSFDGFTIQNVADTAIASGGNYGGISDTVSIINNRVIDVATGSGLYTNGDPVTGRVYNWTVSNNLFDNIHPVGANSPVGSGINLWKVTGGTISNNVVTNSAFGGIQINSGDTVTITGNTITNTAHNGINIAESTGVQVSGNSVTDANTSGTVDEAGMTLYGGTTNVTFACNNVGGSGTNGFSTDSAITDPFSGIKVFDNAIVVGSDISHNLAQSIVIGSNWYGGSAPTVNGSNAAGAQVATALPANPIGNPACGDNTTIGSVLAVSGTPQTTVVSTAFANPLKARVVDLLGGSISGVAIGFAAPGSGASATLSPNSGISDFDGAVSISATANALSGSYIVNAAAGSSTADFALTNSGLPSVALTLNGPASAVAGTATPGYTAQLSNTGSAVPENVLVDFVLSRPAGLNAGDVTLEYNTGSGYAAIPLAACGSNLCGSFGPPGTGFPMGAGYNSTTQLRFTSLRSGAITLVANVDGVTSHSSYATSSLTVNVSAQATTIAANGPITFIGNAGDPLAGALPSVIVTDANGNPASGVSITFAAAANSGSLTGATQVTGSNGIATLGGWTLNSAPGTNTVTASASGLTGSPVTFTATTPNVTLTLNGPAQALVVTAPYTDFVGYAATIGNSGATTPQKVHYEIAVVRIDDNNSATPGQPMTIGLDDVQVCVNDPSGAQSDNKGCPASAPESLFYSEIAGALNGRTADLFRYPINPANDNALPNLPTTALPPSMLRFKYGDYQVHASLVGDDDGTVYATTVSQTSVPNAAITFNGATSGQAEDALLSTTTLTNMGGRVALGNVIVRITLSDTGSAALTPADAEFDYQLGASYQALPWTQSGNNLVTYFGPPSGFPLPDGYNQTTAGRGIFHREGSYTLLYEVLDATNLTPLYASQSITPITIGANQVNFTLSDLNQVFNGSARAVTVSASPSTATYTVLYEALTGSSCPASADGTATATPPTNAGSYCVYVAATGTYQGSASGKLVVAKATATVSIDGAVSGTVSRTFDNTPQVVTGTATASPMPTGTVSLTYSGDPSAPTAAGSYSLVATLTDPNYTGSATGTLVIATPSGVTITLDVVTETATYDGNPHAVTATTAPVGIAYTVTYVGSGSTVYPLTTTAPIAAGMYNVVATTADSNYANPPVSASGTLTISPAAVTLSIAGVTVTYNGQPQGVTVTATPPSVTYSVSYSGNAPTSYGPSSTPPTNAGSYTATATSTDPNYTGTGTGTLTIDPAVGQVNFGTTNFTYDGTAHSTTAVISQEPGDTAACNLSATSGTYPITHAGTTSLSANCTGTNYTATGSTTLTVSPATVTLALNGTGSFVYSGSADVATASVSGAVSPDAPTALVSYNPGGTNAPVNVGVYNVVAMLDPSFTDYTATPANGVIQITPAAAAVTITNTTQTFDGNPKPVTVTTTPSSLTTSVTYDGSNTVPSAVGSYTVVATVTDPNYTGSASATLQIVAANAPDLGVTIIDGRPYVQYGKTLTYIITVNNVGNTLIGSGTVSDTLPPELDASTATAQCFVVGIATCTAPIDTSTGVLSGTVSNVPVNGGVTFVVTATVSTAPNLASEQVVNQVTVGTSGDTNSVNDSATSTTQIVIFRNGFEVGGDGANETASALQATGTLDDNAMLSLDPAQAPQGNAPATWIRATDAQGREVFRVDALHVGKDILVRIVSSDVQGRETQGSWMTLGTQPAGLALADTSASHAVILVVANGGDLKAAIPAWAALPLKIYTAQ